MLHRREQREVFHQNGFDFVEGPDSNLLLAGVPFSKNMTFDKADVQELAHLLHDGAAAPATQAVPASQRGPVNVSDRIPRPTRSLLLTVYA